MPVTPIGTNTITALSRRLILPKITDNVYNSNVLFYRWYHANKRTQQGGTQIEVPLMYKRMAAGGSYQGYQLLNVTPSDTIQNSALKWAQYYVPVTVDGLSLLRADSPLAVADYVATQFKQADMEMQDLLGAGLWSDGSGTDMDGLQEIIDTGSEAPTYGGISRSGNTWWQCQEDSSTTTLTLIAMNNLFGACKSGGRAPTLIASDTANYNRYWALNLAPQQFPVQPGGKDIQLAQAGFENLLFNGVPFVEDDQIPSDTTNSGPYYLNEDYFDFCVAARADFHLQPFQTPTNQDAMTALLLWAGNITCGNVQRQGKFTAIEA